MSGRVETADWLVVLGALLIGAALWMAWDWPGVMGWIGVLMLLAGVAEARRKGR